MAKRFINAPGNVVPELMQGISLDSSRVTLVDPASGHAIAIRSSIASKTQSPRVSVVSGGGSGHEPMAAGYVGEGMLAGAVAGGVFASPSVPAIVTLLDTLAPRSQGILVVFMNYEGDRLNFGMAVDKIKRQRPGYPISVVVVGDDVALPNSSNPRGIAGAVFVLKVAGAAADQGRTLQEVTTIAETAARSICSFGIALEPCTLPGQQTDHTRLGADEVELGMGIHGEPGASKESIPASVGTLTNHLIGTVCRRVDAALQAKKELVKTCTALAIMVNNLGSVSQAELLIICKAVADFLFGANAVVFNGNKYPVHMYSGSFMTSLQMNGISVSCFMLPSDNGHMNQLLHLPTAVAAWNPGFQVISPSQRPVIPVSQESDVKTSHGNQQRPDSRPNAKLSQRTQRYFMAITSALLRHTDELTKLDLRTGDGDFGSTVQSGCERVRADLERGHYNVAKENPAMLFELIAGSVGESMGGTSGALTATFFQAAAQALRRPQTDSGLPPWRIAVVDGTRAVMEQGRAQIGDRTLIDALKPAADVLATPGRSLADAAREALIGYEATKSLTRAKFGRSAHVRESMLLNHADPGAYAVWLIFKALVEASGLG